MRNYSIKEQKQNELQWWGEQRLCAYNEGDHMYRQCEQTIDRLTKRYENSKYDLTVFVKCDIYEYV